MKERLLYYGAIILCVVIFMVGCTCHMDKEEVQLQTRDREFPVWIETEYQVIDGFGASDCWRCRIVGEYWPEEKKNKIADLLFSQNYDNDGSPLGIGLSIWRFNIGAGSYEQGADSRIGSEWKRNECFLCPSGEYDMSKQSGQQWFLKAASDRGVSDFLAFSLSPPVFMTENGYAFPTEKTFRINIKSGMLDDYASFLAESIKRLQHQIGIKINYLSPVNEPQYDWVTPGLEATSSTNEEISELVHGLSEELQSRGLDTKIVVGEAGALRYLYGEAPDAPHADNQIKELWSKDSEIGIGSLPNVAKIISSHSYWSVWPIEFQISERKKLRSALGAVPGLKYWQTEYCIMENIEDDIVPGGGGWQRDLGMNTALFVARIIHNDLVMADASSWQWWTALTRADYKDGLIYLDDGTNEGCEDNDEYCRSDGFIRESKLLWTFGNYSFFIRPGMVRIGVGQPAVQSEESLLLSAFKDSHTGKIVVVVVNPSSAACRFSLDFGEYEVDEKWTPYVTSEEYDLRRREIVYTDSMVVCPRSVTTFVGKYNL